MLQRWHHEKGGAGQGDSLDLDLVADLKAHRTPQGCTMAFLTALHIGHRPAMPYEMHSLAIDGPSLR